MAFYGVKHTWLIWCPCVIFLCECKEWTASNIFSFFSFFRCRSQLQVSVHILPYMAAMHHLGDDPPGRSEVTLLSVISEANIQTLRRWTIPSASNHQRFMHPESSRGPLADHGGADINERGKKSWYKRDTKSNKEDALIFLKKPLLQKHSSLQDSGHLYEHTDKWAMNKPGLWRKSSQASKEDSL